MENRLLGTLGICRKAGKLIWGFDAVAEAVADKTAGLVLLAQDLSPKSAKEMRFHCAKHSMNAYTIPANMDEIGHLLGKRTGILAVTDEGLAHKIKTALPANEEE